MMLNVMRKVTLAAMLAVPAMVASTGCDKVNDLKDGLCCTEYQPGSSMADVDWKLEGQAEVQFSAFMQASGDFVAASGAIVGDLAVVCQELAVDLGANDSDVQETEPGAKAEAWCGKAADLLDAKLKAAGQITIKAQPPVCTISASAKADCEASCTGDASCKVTPGELPQCDGGELQFTCEGQCSGKCSGSADLAVTCSGQCDGTCEGTCNGTNSGGSCAGKCEGKCRGTCTAEASASVTCEGECTGSCSGTAKAPKCTGGSLPKAKCNVDANCQGSCNASVQAKADCQPGSITVDAAGSLDARTIAALEGSLPRIRALLEGRAALLAGNVEALVSLTGSISGSVTASAKATGCLATAVVPTVGKAASELGAALRASGKLSATLSAHVGQ